MKLIPLILVSFVISETTPAAERVALVIGNDAYQHTGKLDNCVNDARAVGAVLKEAGFAVVAAENATAEQMHEKLAEFKRQAAGCKVGLFFYAGHGMEDEGKNYLVPVDAALERKAQVPMQTLGLAQVMEKMKEARIPAKIVLLDCCRNMPLGRGWRATRGGGGMAAVDGASLPESTLVYFATDPGTEALDAGASGKHSPFTDGLLQKLKTPGIHAFEALMQVEDVVHLQTGGRQRPKLFSDGETAAFRGFSFAALLANSPGAGNVPPNASLTQERTKTLSPAPKISKEWSETEEVLVGEISDSKFRLRFKVQDSEDVVGTWEEYLDGAWEEMEEMTGKQTGRYTIRIEAQFSYSGGRRSATRYFTIAKKIVNGSVVYVGKTSTDLNESDVDITFKSE